MWPGGAPTGEDEGFNGIIVRTRRGLELYEAALAAGQPIPDTNGPRSRDCARLNSVAENLAEARSARRRSNSARLREPPAVE